MFVESPEISKIVDKGDVAAVIELVKPASDIYSSAAGQTTEINNALLDDLRPFTPEGALGNWLFKLKITDITVLNHLMSEDAYNELFG